MSKVARAARVASKQRAEVLGSGTSAPTAKVIGAAETGELYMINHNNASTLTITLPPIADGAYFRFQLMTALTANGAISIVKHADTSAGQVKGTVLCVVYAGSSADTTLATNKDLEYMHEGHDFWGHQRSFRNQHQWLKLFLLSKNRLNLWLKLHLNLRQKSQWLKLHRNQSV